MGYKRGGLLIAVAIWVGLLVSGCRTPWVRGEVVAVMPQYVEKCRADVAFFVSTAKRAKLVKNVLESALRARGFEVVEKQDECDVVVKVEANSWEYNDAGFSGFGERNDMRLTITLFDRRKKTILGRWQVEVKSDFRILEQWAEKV